MLVKCSVCGKKIDKATAYIANVKVNKRDGSVTYKKANVCSEAEWNQKLKADSDRKEMITLVNEYLGDTKNTVLFKEISLWGEPNKIVRFIKENRNKFDIMYQKVFETEYQKIRYFSAIIKNNINDMPDEIKEEPIKIVELEWYENKHKNKKRRKCLADYE